MMVVVWQLERSCENHIGVTKDKHLSSDARARVGGGCFFLYTGVNESLRGTNKRTAPPRVFIRVFVEHSLTRLTFGTTVVYLDL